MSAKTPGGRDWASLAAIVVIWGSAYALTRAAVEHFHPALLVSTRLWIGAAVLVVLTYATGVRLPTLRDVDRWRSAALIGFTGIAAPFTIITWAQQYVDSALAGIYIAAAPLMTLTLAHFFVRHDRATTARFAGFAIGFAGVAILVGGEAFGELGEAGFLPQAALLAASALYAGSNILIARAPSAPPLQMAATFVLCGAIFTTPFGLASGAAFPREWTAIAAALGLALGPTVIAQVIYAGLLRRTSPSFVATSGYLVPIWAVMLGAIAFAERPGINALVGLAVILFGVFIARRQTGRTPHSEDSNES